MLKTRRYALCIIFILCFLSAFAAYAAIEERSQLLYAVFLEEGSTIFTIKPDGTEERQLTTASENAMHPVWSPDGRTIAFSAYREDNQDIYLMDADGSNLVRLTNNPANDLSPVWRP